jgi:hypothetical protein
MTLDQDQPVVPGCLISLPPVLTNRGCKLVSDQLCYRFAWAARTAAPDSAVASRDLRSSTASVVGAAKVFDLSSPGGESFQPGWHYEGRLDARPIAAHERLRSQRMKAAGLRIDAL